MSAQFYQEKLRSASTDIVDGRKRDFYDNKKKRDALIEDIYNDIYPMEGFSVNQSFSNGNSDAESSIFDNVERKAFVDDDTEKHIPNLSRESCFQELQNCPLHRKLAGPLANLVLDKQFLIFELFQLNRFAT